MGIVYIRKSFTRCVILKTNERLVLSNLCVLYFVFPQSKLVRGDDLRTFLMFRPDIHDIVRFKIWHKGMLGMLLKSSMYADRAVKSIRNMLSN